MKNLELWVTNVNSTFTVLDRWAFSFEGKNPVIKYFCDSCSKINPVEIKQKIKRYITEKYNKCEPTIDVNSIYQNILTNIKNARFEVV
ncbi:MAG: hypothetical protein KKB62_00655 [Nanoarchaeota archaeon]|nr:hypothetical protein [Nanoarchaeota archaeon]